MFESNQNRGPDSLSSRTWRLSGLGMEFAGATIGMGAIGWAIDWAAGTQPWFLLSLGLAGFVGGMYLLIRDGLRAQSHMTAAYQRDQHESDRS